MSKVNKVIKIVLYLTLIVCAVLSYVGYTISQDILKYIGYGATALNLLCIIIVEVVTTIKKKKESGEDFGLLDFLQIVYNCLPILVGYAESIDKVSGGAIKGKEKENAVIEQLKLICDQQKVKFYEEQARAIITPIIESDKIIQKVKDGTLTFADISQMLNELKTASGEQFPKEEEKSTAESTTVVRNANVLVESADIDNSVLLANNLLRSNTDLKQTIDRTENDNKSE